MEFPQERPLHDISAIFAEEKATEHGFLRASAPMVRYSKLEFRKLIRKHGVKLSFTPMIIADSFNNSLKARLNEFTTTADDQPLIAQFAACDSSEFNIAAQLIYPYVDGIDLNCGCPQSWAIGKGYGCGLLRKPELVHDIVRTVRRLLPTDFSVSVKIRLLSNESADTTTEFVRQLEQCGVTFLTLHGRTPWQRSSDPLNLPAMASVKQALRVPLIVNGNVRCWQDACDLYAETGADGVMAARGLLANPTLFDPDFKTNTTTPRECIQEWLDIATRAGDNLQTQCFHHHLTFMCASQMEKKLRLKFNSYSSKTEIFQFFDEHYGIRPDMESSLNPLIYTNCTYSHYEVPQHCRKFKLDDCSSWNPNSEGKYFSEFKDDIVKNDEEPIGLAGSFLTEVCS